VRQALFALRPSSCLNIKSRETPLTNFWCWGSRRLLRRGGQPRARPHSCNAALADRPRTHKYQLAPPSARLQGQGMTPLLPPRGRSPHHFSVEFFEKRSSPHQNLKIGRGIPSPRFGAGIGNATLVHTLRTILKFSFL